MFRKYFTIITLALVFALGAACVPKGGKTAPPRPGEGKTTALGKAPEGFALVDAASFKEADYKGKVLVMDFWATWCGPCKMEIPHLIELQKEYRDQGLVVVGITLDEDPDASVPPYAAEVGMNYANVRGNDALKSKYGVIGLPTIVIYDRGGNQVMKRSGYIEKENLRNAIKPLLAPASS